MSRERDRLFDLARRYAEQLRQRPNALGLALYGSLAVTDPREITRFSDIDYALVLDGEPPTHFVEHRVVEGVRLDVLYFPAEDVRDLVLNPPRRLFDRGWVMHFLIKSLVLGAPDTIHFDRSGHLSEAKQCLKAETSYQELVAADARGWLHHFVTEHLLPASRHLDAGEHAAAVESAARAGRGFGGVLGALANTKARAAAAERLGIPEFEAKAVQLEALSRPQGAEAIWQAAVALWEHSLRRAYEPVQAGLQRAGVPEPTVLELYGDHRVFWPGNRMHELGRVIDDVNLSLEWSRSELDSGNVAEALGILFPCREARATLDRWTHLDTALQAAGYDFSRDIQTFLTDPETQSLAAALDQANAGARIEATSAQAEEAVRLAEELRVMAERTCGLPSERER